MADKINKIQCAENTKNTGICACFFDPKLIVGKIIGPLNKVFTEAELATLQATFEALVMAPKAQRIYPVQNFVGITDNSEDTTFQTFGYGSSAPSREGNYVWIFQFIEGGVQLSNALRSFNGKSSKFGEMYISLGLGKTTLIGTAKTDVNGDPGLGFIKQEGGYPYTYPWKANDGTNTTQYRTASAFRPEQINEALAFVEVDAAEYLLTSLAGLEDVTLKNVEVDGDTITVTAKTSCGSDLFADEGFEDELAQVTAWSLTDADGEAVEILAVTKNEAAGGWDIQAEANIEDGWVLTMAAPTVLAASPINVSGYEAGDLEIAIGSGS